MNPIFKYELSSCKLECMVGFKHFYLHVEVWEVQLSAALKVQNESTLLVCGMLKDLVQSSEEASFAHFSSSYLMFVPTPPYEFKY